MTREELYRMQVGDYVIADYSGFDELAMIVEIGEDGWCKARSQDHDFDDCINDIRPIKIGAMTAFGLRLEPDVICGGTDEIFNEQYRYWFRDKQSGQIHGTFLLTYVHQIQHFMRIYGYWQEAQFSNKLIMMYR